MKTPGPSKQFEAPKQHWPAPATPPPGSPNIVLMMLDDVGFADFGCYGSEIDTPCIDRVAARGVRYGGFHTTAMCSTTRAALLTGRNHHAVGVGCLANFDSGYPGYRGKISKRRTYFSRDATRGRLSQLHGGQMARYSTDRDRPNWPL